jgi:2-polyprenyl-3-methyl-5-hydroxy-6-metoxy-1,4-benzoquinol methylase
MTGASARYDEIADFYDERAGRSVADGATAALLTLAGQVSGLHLLELACGQGRVTRELARRGARVTGVDISAAMLEGAKEAETRQPLGIKYVQADVTDPGVLDGQVFDAVACNHGLADVDDLDGLLATVIRVLAPGGWFVFSLLHPCFPGWDGDAPSSWPPSLGYFHEGWWLASNQGFRGKVGANHRTLSTYVNSLAGQGLLLEEVVERPADAERQAQLPGAAPVPFFLAARASRR